MIKIDIAGLKINAITKADLLKQLADRIKSNQKTWVTTPYSEFLYSGIMDGRVMDMLNQADFAVADGIGMFWAKKYLEIPLTAKSYWGKILQAVWQIKYSLAAIIFYPSWIKSALPEKIPGSDLVWDLSKMASDNNFSIYMLGGFGDTAKLAAEKIKITKFDGRQILLSNKNPNDPSALVDINKANPDILLVAYGPIRQEKWILENLPKLNVKLAIGLGGTFDYLAGRQPQPPRFLRKTGLEWLWRLITQPKRYKRIFNATFGLASALLRYKIFAHLPFRKNVVSVVLNKKNEIFIAKFNPEKKVLRALGYARDNYNNFWQLPQGGLEEGENVIEAAKRELGEETAMSNVHYLKTSEKTYSYQWEDSAQRPLFVAKRYRFKGQYQHVVYFKFLGDDKEIKLDQDELADYKWVSQESLVEKLHPQKQHVATIALQGLKEMQEKGII